MIIANLEIRVGHDKELIVRLEANGGITVIRDVQRDGDRMYYFADEWPEVVDAVARLRRGREALEFADAEAPTGRKT